MPCLAMPSPEGCHVESRIVAAFPDLRNLSFSDLLASARRFKMLAREHLRDSNHRNVARFAYCSNT